MKTLSLKLPEPLDAKLTAAAKQRGTNKSVLIRDAIETYLSHSNEPLENSFLDLAKEFIGCVEGPKDLSFNKEYMKGYGRDQQ